MTENTSPTPGQPPRPHDQHDQHDQHGAHGARRGPHRHGHGRRGARLATLWTDAPIGTGPEALAEAFLGVGQLLRARGRVQGGWQRRAGRLTFARSALLAALDTDSPQRMGELAHRLGVVPRTVTPMVDALEADGLLEREPDPDDRRATLLRITAAGTAELARTRSDRQSSLDEVFAGLTEPDREALARILQLLRGAARQGLDPADDSANDPPDGPAGAPGGVFPGHRLRGRGPGRPHRHGLPSRHGLTRGDRHPCQQHIHR